jgi:uncharacterized spore protein YtfJ
MDVGNLLSKVSENLSVRRAFGTAYERDGMLIIPVAIVAGGGGGGTSSGRRGGPGGRHGQLPAADTTAQDTGHDAGQESGKDAGPTDAGGGFGGLVLPSGVYVVKGDQVRWVPAIDVTVAVVAGLSLLRVILRPRGRRRG